MALLWILLLGGTWVFPRPSCFFVFGCHVINPRLIPCNNAPLKMLSFIAKSKTLERAGV
jgi:hypothetical protein